MDRIRVAKFVFSLDAVLGILSVGGAATPASQGETAVKSLAEMEVGELATYREWAHT